jgi:tetratricopeptide (TPR) repeat protein
MGDDAGVLAVVSQDRGQGTLMEASLGHLAAVASLRLGREEDARRLWEQALSVSPSLSVAQANLDDLARPVEERAGPWAFSVENWVPERAMLDLIGHVERIGQGSSQDALERQARAFLRRHPEMVPLVPILFDRGDPAARTFAFALAGMAHTPEMQAAVRDFALSRRGPDALRMQALQQSREEGLLPETARVWIKGEWRDLELRGYEIHDESLHSHSPEVARLVIEAVLLLQDRQAKAAEELLLQALVLEPDAPDIMNNLATAYGQQQRGREARLILERLHAQHPDYLFAAANLASMAARDGRIPEARALLEPFQSRTRLHRTEFASLSSAQIELALAEGDPESARIMFDMWEGIDPDHPLLDHFLGRIEDAAVPERRLSARPTGR